jgi:hypothetical protein
LASITQLPTAQAAVRGQPVSLVANDDNGREEVVQSNWERILWRGDRLSEPIAIDVVSHEFLAEYAREAGARFESQP